MDEYRYHHARSLAHAPAGIVWPASALGRDAREWAPAYAWMASVTGYAPLFLAVGASAAAWEMTGYATDAADIPPQVCFSWRDAPGVVRYSDFEAWHRVLNAIDGATLTMRPIDALTRHAVLRPHWDAQRWEEEAASGHRLVQAVTPMLDLTSADMITCPDAATARCLAARGFDADRLRIAGYRPRHLPGVMPPRLPQLTTLVKAA